MGAEKRRILVIGGGFAGFVVARHCRKHFDVTVVDAKEYFEYTPGILRAFVSPSHLSELTFKYQPVFEGTMGVRFIWGEVTELKDQNWDRQMGFSATVKPISGGVMQLNFDYIVIASGCNFGMFHPVGESLWFPTVWEKTRAKSDWKQHDERYLDGRRDHINEECAKIAALNKKKDSKVLIVGAGFIGVEFATEIQAFFPNIEITLIDMLPKCLGPLPESAKDYCQKYMDKVGIKTKYGIKYNPTDPDGWKSPQKRKEGTGMSMAPDAFAPTEALMEQKPDMIYISTGFKASCYFMPNQTLTQFDCTATDNNKLRDERKFWGPAGGGWIRTDLQLHAVWRQDGQEKPFLCDDKGNGRCFAVGDCNLMADLPPIPKISYPGEEMAAVACRQIEVIERTYYNNSSSGCYTVPKFWPCIPCYGTLGLTDFWWPWGSGMFATSLGVDDACFVIAANHNPGSGYMVVWGYLCAWQKWFIEWSKGDQCKEGWIGWATWMSVH